MPKVRTYECASCARRFTFMHHPAEEPAFCPHCGFNEDAMNRHTQELAMPAIGTRKGSNPDNLVRAMEEGSQFRATMAQELGASPEETRGLVLTNARDNLRAGDTSFVPVTNDITRLIAHGSGGGLVGNASAEAGAMFARTVGVGPQPFAGARTMAHVRAAHPSLVGPVTRSGEMGRGN